MGGSRILATSFAARLGADSASSDNLVYQLPPLVPGIDECRIDLTPLLLHGSIVMNKASFDCVTSSKHKKVRSLARQLADFWEAGLVELVDFSVRDPRDLAILNGDADIATQFGRDFWVGELRQTILWWEGARPGYRSVYGDLKPMYPWSICDVMEQVGLPDTDKSAAFVRSAIFEDDDDEKRGLTNIALRAILNYTNSNKVNSFRLSSIVYDWQHMYGFMTAGDRLAHEYGGARTLEAARFVVYEIAAIDPSELSNDHVIAMLTDRRIQDFRRYVDESTNLGVDFLESEKESLYRRLVDYRVKVMKNDRMKVLLRLAKSATLGNIALMEELLQAFGSKEFVVKTVDEYIKSVLMETTIERAPPMAAMKAVYALRKHIHVR